jgi:hypothetical protein
MVEKVKFVSIFFMVAILLSTGCAGIGPRTVARDRFDYTTALSESWKSQMLLNMVKMRYGDAPIFLDVASVINQYAVEQEFGLGASGEFYNRSEPSFIGPEVGARRKYTDRPTITYNPLTGEKFARSLMTPVPPAAIISLVQAGYAVNTVFRGLIHEINGVRNRFGGGARARAADPEFYPLLEKMQKIQSAGVIGMRFKKIDKEDVALLIFSPKRDATTDSLVNDVR